MANVVIVGTQWGDEGKGKIVDLLAEYADVVVRFQGGNNAGHTMVVGDEQLITHLVPSGILQKKLCVIGNGVVLQGAGHSGARRARGAATDRVDDDERGSWLLQGLIDRARARQRVDAALRELLPHGPDRLWIVQRLHAVNPSVDCQTYDSS